MVCACRYVRIILNHIVNNADLDRTFAALSDPTRRAIVARLLTDVEASVGALAGPFAMSLPAVSKHLSVLERAGLVERTRDGRNRLCRAQPDALRDAADWLEKHRVFWAGSLERLACHLEADAPTSKRPKPKY